MAKTTKSSKNAKVAASKDTVVKKSVKNDIVKKIKTNDIKMQSAQHFLILSVATVVSTVLLTLTAALLTRFLLDDLNEYRRIRPLDFGPEGKDLVFTNFPWILLILTAVTIYATFKLYRKFELSYKHNLMVFYSGLGASIVVLAIVIGGTGLSGNLQRAPILKELRGFDEFKDNYIIYGELISIDENSMIVLTPIGDELEIDITTSNSFGMPLIGQSVTVVVEGKDEQIIKASLLKFGGPMHRPNIKMK